jgi:DNA invertase Pin-like site-specific DNA recombinase
MADQIALKDIRKTMSLWYTIRKLLAKGFSCMLVGYMRVSSDSDRQTTNLQRDALTETGVDSRHLFEDHGSGAKDDRPGLSEALAFVRPGDVLVVWKLDRLGRSLSHLLSIINELKEKRVAFRSLTEGMDTTTPSGELLFHVFGALAQYERALTTERVVAGLAAARRRGRIGGRPPAIVGEKLEAITTALKGGMNKAAVCRNFGVKRTTLIETLARISWPTGRQ